MHQSRPIANLRRRLCRGLRRPTAVSILLLAGLAARAGDTVLRSYDLPAGDAAFTLKLFIEQSDEPVLYPPGDVAGVRTNAVKGTMTSGEALDLMLARTGLVATRDDQSGGYTIRRVATDADSPKSREPTPSDVTAGGEDNAGPSRGASARGDGLGDTVVLSPFVVQTASGADRYLPTESTSGGRVRVNLMDSPQSVSVITSEVVDDVGAERVLDAMQYVPGVSESSIPNGLDRMNIRGFLTTSRTLDGVTTQYSDSQGNLDPFLVERMELVMGPNAILAPAMNPGGTINNISKKPEYHDFGEISASFSQYGGGRDEIDVNRVVDPSGKLAIRILSAVEDETDYYGEHPRETLFAPMLSYRFSPTTEFIWQTDYIDERIDDYYDGIAVDPAASSTDRANLYPGAPRNLNIYGPDSYRNDGRVENTATFLTRLGDLIDLHVLYRHSNEYTDDNSMTTLSGSGTPASTNANSYDPYTGLYTPGIVYSAAPPYTATAVALSPTFNRSGSRLDENSQHDNLQVDLHNTYSTPTVKAESLLGYAFDYDRGIYIGNALTSPPVTLTDFVYSPDVLGALNRNQQYYSWNNQVYASESLSFLNDRLIVDGSYSRDYWSISIDDQLQHKDVALAPSAGMASYGIVAKPVENVSVYYSHSQDAAILPIANLATTPNLPLQYGVQDEEGVRWLLLQNRLRLTIDHYQIVQNNTNVQNPANFAYPPPVPALPGLLTDRTARGWEFAAQGALTTDLSIIAGYTNFKNRNPFGQVFRGVAERTASLLLHYSFDRIAALRGLAATAGIDYMSKRAGDDATGFTPLGVPHQTDFWLPARTLVNLGLAYDLRHHVQVEVYVDNALDAQYLLSDLSRGTVWPGQPTDVRLKLGYRF